MNASLRCASSEALGLDDDVPSPARRTCCDGEANEDTMAFEAPRDAVWGEAHFPGGVFRPRALATDTQARRRAGLNIGLEV